MKLLVGFLMGGAMASGIWAVSVFGVVPSMPTIIFTIVVGIISLVMLITEGNKDWK